MDYRIQRVRGLKTILTVRSVPRHTASVKQHPTVVLLLDSVRNQFPCSPLKGDLVPEKSGGYLTNTAALEVSSSWYRRSPASMRTCSRFILGGSGQVVHGL